MAGKRKKNRRGGALREFGFILAVIVLLAALAGIYYLHMLQNQAELEKRQEIVDRELSPGGMTVQDSVMVEEEQAAPAEEQEEDTESKEAGEEEASDDQRKQSESGHVQEAEGESESAADELPPTTEETPAQEDAPVAEGEQDTSVVLENMEQSEILDASVVVLNGSYRNGAASYWEKQLSDAGFTHLSVGTYAGQAEEKTVIYTLYPEKAQGFLTFFPNAEIREGEPSAAVTISSGNPDNRDYIVVIGIADAALSQ